MLSIDYSTYRCKDLNSRTFSYQDMQKVIAKNPLRDNFEVIGKSFEGREIKLLKIGKGPTKILLWSQMHGDEATATAAIFDLINFFNGKHPLVKSILENCKLHFIPVVNPDGMEKFTRLNAQSIDINRDFLAQQSPEGKILKQIKETIKPDFAFNLHDQDSLYSMPKTKETVAISLLAPTYDESKNINWNREQAIKVIVCINESLQKLKTLQIARFNDEFEPRAFGDNFQKEGIPTILIESGYLKYDNEKQEIRKLNFFAILSALKSIALQYFQEKDIINYFMIPVQKKELFHILLKNVTIEKRNLKFKATIGMNYKEVFEPKKRTLQKQYFIAEIGDLSFSDSLETIDAQPLSLKGKLKIDKLANFILYNLQEELIIGFNSGIRI